MSLIYKFSHVVAGLMRFENGSSGSSLDIDVKS